MLIRQTESRLRRPASVCRPEPLGPRQCRQLAAVLAGLDPDWCVELQHDVYGKPTIIILPEDDDDATSPTLILQTDEVAFVLDELGPDAHRKLGEYRAWNDVVRAVRIRLTWEMPIPRTVH
jgi:hypothetical protein